MGDRITRWQFVEWSPAMLAAELSRGRKPRDDLTMYLCRRKEIGSDTVYMEKILMLVRCVCLSNARWVMHVDKNLDPWMFIKIADIILERLPVSKGQNIGPNVYSYIYNVDNIKYILSKNVNMKRTVYWNRLRPLSRIRELIPWVDDHVWKYMLSDVTLAILGYKGEQLCFKTHENVCKVIKYSEGYKGIYYPRDAIFLKLEMREITRLIEAGWTIRVSLKDLSTFKSFYNLKQLCDTIIEKGNSDWLFGEKNPAAKTNLEIYKEL